MLEWLLIRGRRCGVVYLLISTYVQLRYRVQKTRSGNCFSKCLPTVKKGTQPELPLPAGCKRTKASEEVTVSSVEWTISFLFFYGERFGLWGWGCVTVAEFNTRHSMEWDPPPTTYHNLECKPNEICCLFDDLLFRCSIRGLSVQLKRARPIEAGGGTEKDSISVLQLKSYFLALCTHMGRMDWGHGSALIERGEKRWNRCVTFFPYMPWDAYDSLHSSVQDTAWFVSSFDGFLRFQG